MSFSFRATYSASFSRSSCVVFAHLSNRLLFTTAITSEVDLFGLVRGQSGSLALSLLINRKGVWSAVLKSVRCHYQDRSSIVRRERTRLYFTSRGTQLTSRSIFQHLLERLVVFPVMDVPDILSKKFQIFVRSVQANKQRYIRNAGRDFVTTFLR